MGGRDPARPVLETVTTTLNADGTPNCAAMGVDWGEPEIVIRPWSGTRTLRNLRRHGEAVVHLVDDVELFVLAALGDPHPPATPATRVAGFVLDDACSWREVRVRAIDDSGPRAVVVADVVAAGRGREFLGLNRARHAVLEASILASRLHLEPAADVAAELDALQILVDKTAGPTERAAMDLVREHVRARAGVAGA
jgi:uncharacterized protein